MKLPNFKNSSGCHAVQMVWPMTLNLSSSSTVARKVPHGPHPDDAAGNQGHGHGAIRQMVDVDAKGL
jgi:hypothetical protein